MQYCHVQTLRFTGFLSLLGTWRPYKELQAVVERSLYKKTPEVYHELEVALKKFKPDFISLLKNPVSPEMMLEISGSSLFYFSFLRDRYFRAY